MPALRQELVIDRCPLCNISHPRLSSVWRSTTTATSGEQRFWVTYVCASCGGLVTAVGRMDGGEAEHIYPTPHTVDDALPSTAKQYLEQGYRALHAPAGAVMLAASAVDAMLKAKGYKEGSLSSRINKASEEHLITAEMAQWAHDVRLDANDQRHSDENAALPDEAAARRALEFASALSTFLFTLPARVQRGIKDAAGG